MNSLQIRAAEEKDLDALVALTKLSFAQYCRSAGIETTDACTETRDDVARDLREKTVLVAERNGELVAAIRLCAEGDVLHVSRFCVGGAYQRLGIGGRLLDEAADLARARGMKRMALFTASHASDLVRFYYRNGFYVNAVSSERGYLRLQMLREL